MGAWEQSFLKRLVSLRPCQFTIPQSGALRCASLPEGYHCSL